MDTATTGTPALARPRPLTAPPLALPGLTLDSPWLLALGYFAVAVALRGAVFGNPVVHLDEQFYQLVSERWVEGSLPYVAVWDRKPIGLFALYRALRWIGGEGPLPVQLAACAAVAATALVIRALALRIASPFGAGLAGLAYCALLDLFDCAGGQTPVFYNLPVALAALAVVRAHETRDANAAIGLGAGAMALTGLALSIKTSAIFEGMGFGVMLLVRGWHLGWRWPRLPLAGAMWIALALAPTLLAFAAYCALGHGATFSDANFLSIFRRRNFADTALPELAKTLAVLTPFWIAAGLGLSRIGLRRIAPREPGAAPVLGWWLIVAVGAFLAIGPWYDHYIAPVLVPLTVLAAPTLDPASRRHSGWLAALVALPLLAAPIVVRANIALHGTTAEAERLAHAIAGELGSGCLYLYEGDPALYRLTRTCLPTRFAFPPHLSTAEEASALGVDPGREVARILATRPTVIALTATPYGEHPNRTTRALLQTALARDYTLYGEETLGHHRYLLYRLRQREARAN